MATIYKGDEAAKVCNMILANEDYSTPIEGYDVCSSGYWRECGKWIAYDNMVLSIRNRITPIYSIHASSRVNLCFNNT